MTEKVSFRWKTFFAACTLVLFFLVVVFFSTGDITKFKLTMQMQNRSMLTKRSEISKAKSVSKTTSICRTFEKPNSNVTNTTRKGCSVPIFRSTDQRDYYSQNSSCPTCTSALFKDYYQTHKALMAEGYWDVLYSGKKVRSATFRPPFCSFTRRDLDPDYSRKCFSRKRIRKIVALGDSVGKRTFAGMQIILGSTGIKQCQPVKVEKEGYFLDIKYYLPAGSSMPSGHVKIVRRGCHSCYARQSRCFYESKDKSGTIHKTPVILEFLPLTLILDSSLLIVNSTDVFRPNNYTQEFLFRDYLGSTGQPDVVIIAAPFLHEVHGQLERYGKAGLKGAIRKLATILERYLPMSTEIYWLPTHYVFGGKISVKVVDQCNEDLYEVLKREFGDEGSRMHGTFDVLRTTCPLVDLSISHDPNHMQPKWYEVIGKHLLELICN